MAPSTTRVHDRRHTFPVAAAVQQCCTTHSRSTRGCLLRLLRGRLLAAPVGSRLVRLPPLAPTRTPCPAEVRGRAGRPLCSHSRLRPCRCPQALCAPGVRRPTLPPAPALPSPSPLSPRQPHRRRQLRRLAAPTAPPSAPAPAPASAPASPHHRHGCLSREDIPCLQVQRSLAARPYDCRPRPPGVQRYSIQQPYDTCRCALRPHQGHEQRHQPLHGARLGAGGAQQLRWWRTVVGQGGEESG